MDTKVLKNIRTIILAFLGTVFALVLLFFVTLKLFDLFYNYRVENAYDAAWIKGKTIEEVVERYGEPHKCLSDPGHDETSPHRAEECRYFVENDHGGEDVNYVRCFVDENGLVYNVESAFGWG